MSGSVVVGSVQTDSDYLGGSKTLLPISGSFHQFSTMGSPENDLRLSGSLGGGSIKERRSKKG